MSTWKWLCVCAVCFACGWLAGGYYHRPKPVDKDALRAAMRQAAEKAFDELAAEEARDKKPAKPDPKAIMDLPSMDLTKEAEKEKAPAKTK